MQARKQQWWPDAEAFVDEQIVYVLERYGPYVADDFVARLTEKVDLIAQNPRLGLRIAGEDTFRRMLYRQLFWIYYRFNDKEVDILALVPARSNWKAELGE